MNADDEVVKMNKPRAMLKEATDAGTPNVVQAFPYIVQSKYVDVHPMDHINIASKALGAVRDLLISDDSDLHIVGRDNLGDLLEIINDRFELGMELYRSK